MSNPYRYRHEKIGEAIHCLMSFRMSAPQRIEAAVGEFHTAFLHGVPRGSALAVYNTIQQIIGHNPYPERADQLTESQQAALAPAIWELDRAISSDYYTAEGGKRLIA